MKQSVAMLFVFTAMALAGCKSSGNRTEQDASLSLNSFEYLGCSGDWTGDVGKPEVWRITKENQVSFLVHHVASCGLSGRRPAVSSDQHALSLSYELYSDSDSVIMCDCEYWAKFTFGPEAARIQSVKFGTEDAVLKGNWPGL